MKASGNNQHIKIKHITHTYNKRTNTTIQNNTVNAMIHTNNNNKNTTMTIQSINTKKNNAYIEGPKR